MTEPASVIWKPHFLLGEGPTAHEDLDDLTVRRELAAASVAAPGDLWDDEVDAQWRPPRRPCLPIIFPCAF